MAEVAATGGKCRRGGLGLHHEFLPKTEGMFYSKGGNP